MDIIKLAFEMFKEESYSSRKALRNKIKNQFKNITEKELNEVTLEIINYQIDKYGNRKKPHTMATNDISEGNQVSFHKSNKKYSVYGEIRSRIRNAEREKINRKIEKIYKNKGE